MIRPSADEHAPILEFDQSQTAIIEPAIVTEWIDAPEHCVPCFFREVVLKVLRERRIKKLTSFKYWDVSHSLYEMSKGGQRLAFFYPGVGAPVAASLLENVIASGCRKFIACGSAGVLDSKIKLGHVLVPAAALRDEGTSYHYLPASRETKASPEGVAAVEKVLKLKNVDYTITKTWTTDAPYRETPAAIQRRRAEGCLAVEMEAAACFAVAHFRKVVFAQLLYGGDDVSGTAWNARESSQTRALRVRARVRERLFWLAVESCLTL